MLASSRIARVLRGTVPYAAWAATAIQLGYLGYNLWEKYQDYRRLVQADAISGFNRPLDEAIELVIKPKRIRRNKDNSSNVNYDNQLEIIEGCTTDQENILPSRGQNLSDLELPGTSMQENDDPMNISNTSSNSDVKVVYDSRLLEHIRSNKTNQDDEVLTTVSTSIESTDSNHGICTDMYNECYICANTLNDTSKPVASLPFCFHSFHKKCLEGVLKWHPKCPICDVHIFSPI